MRIYDAKIEFTVIDAAGTPKYDDCDFLIQKLRDLIDAAVFQFAKQPTISVTPASISRKDQSEEEPK